MKPTLLLAILVEFCCLFVLHRPPVVSVGFVVEPLPDRPGPTKGVFETGDANRADLEYVHSAAVVELGGGRLRAFWVGGSREGAADTAIYSSVHEPGAGTWVDERSIVTREIVRRDLLRNVIALGNPVVMRDDGGRLMLWFVSVSAGGWSGSAINLTTSDDDGATWSPIRRLITSPHFNLSTLVKGPPLRFEDGTIGLPVYHEHIGIFAELLRVDAEGRVIHKQRLTRGRGHLQPIIVPRNRDEATCFLRPTRRSPPRVHTIATSDGGAGWTSPSALATPNPGSPVAATRLANGELLLVMNEAEQGRDALSIAISADEGASYQVIHVLDPRPEGVTTKHRVGYPTVLRADDGSFHLLYTLHNRRIKHVHFDLAWLDARR